MAKFSAAGLPAFKKGRSAVVPRDLLDAQPDEFGDDPFIPTHNDFLSESKKTHTKTMIKDVDENKEVAVPIPVASAVPLCKIVTQDGKEHAVYQPIPGFEHLFRTQQQFPQAYSPSRSKPLAPRGPSSTQAQGKIQAYNDLSQNIHQDEKLRDESTRRTKARKASTPKTPKSKSLKRRRSVTEASSRPRPVVQDESDEDDDQTLIAASEESYTFYIGDFEKLKQFLRRRFDELTMKPLRGIITQWIKQLEPRRLGAYGRYHKKLPSEEADEMTPPWWPRDVHYNEPSHLAKTDLLTLAVDVMLLHRRIDDIKRKGSWIAKLRQVALYNIETTPSEHFSSSKGSNFSDLMRDRALKSILPSLFDVASSYEEHLAMYNLYEGAGGTDPGKGKYHTWQPISRPPRRSAQTKRRRTSRATPTSRVESSVDASGDDTESDDTMINMSRDASSVRSRQTQDEIRTPPVLANISDSLQQSWKVGSPVAITEQLVSPPQSQHNLYVPGPMQTPNSSFGDIKRGGHTVSSPPESYPQSNMPVFSQPIQHPSSHLNYDSHMFQPISTTASFSHSTQGSFAQLPAPGFANSFQMGIFEGPYSTQVHQASFLPQVPDETSNPEYPYAYGGLFSHTTMNMPLAPQDVHTPFHGLPMDYQIDSRGSLHR